MLVLSGAIGDKVYIGPDICVEILWTGEHQVRIGFAAPVEVKIMREELLYREYCEKLITDMGYEEFIKERMA